MSNADAKKLKTDAELANAALETVRIIKLGEWREQALQVASVVDTVSTQHLASYKLQVNKRIDEHYNTDSSRKTMRSVWGKVIDNAKHVPAVIKHADKAIITAGLPRIEPIAKAAIRKIADNKAKTAKAAVEIAVDDALKRKAERDAARNAPVPAADMLAAWLEVTESVLTGDMLNKQEKAKLSSLSKELAKKVDMVE